MDLEYAYLIIFIAAILIIRVRRQNKGSKASTARIFRYPAVYMVLSLLLLAYTPSILLLLLTVIAIIIGYVIGNAMGSKSNVFSSGEKILYKRSNEIFAIWITAFVIRIILEFIVPTTSSGLPTASTSSIFSGSYIWYSLVDLLLAFSAGLLLGEALHLYKKYKSVKDAAKQRKEIS